MSPPVTRAVRMLSSMHGQTPAQRANRIASLTVFSKEHFPKFLGFVCLSGFFSGFYLMESLRNKQVRFVRMKFDVVDGMLYLPVHGSSFSACQREC